MTTPKPQIESLLLGTAGIPVVLASAAALFASVAVFLAGLLILGVGGIALMVVGVLGFVASAVVPAGVTPVAPGEARVVQLFGRYKGTVRETGLRWVNPFAVRKRVSTRVRNHETAVTKVNDADGNPIEIAAVLVWQVEDTAKAVFDVDNFVAFVAIQAETAVRHIATSYPYDTADPDQLSLRENAEQITAQLSAEISERVAAAGVRIIESRLTRLSYAPEIAQAMLRRQQAGAVVAARSKIVEGAVGMVESALNDLAQRHVVELDDERRAAMVSNLLVVLCSDHQAQPVVNTGSLYS